jgi:hypothetical protein
VFVLLFDCCLLALSGARLAPVCCVCVCVCVGVCVCVCVSDACLARVWCVSGACLCVVCLAGVWRESGAFLARGACMEGVWNVPGSPHALLMCVWNMSDAGLARVWRIFVSTVVVLRGVCVRGCVYTAACLARVWRVSGVCLAPVCCVVCLVCVWRVSGACLVPVWCLSGACLGFVRLVLVWRVSGACLARVCRGVLYVSEE